MAEIIADKVTLDLIGKDGLGKTAEEKINEAITRIGSTLMRDNMGKDAKINLAINMKRVDGGVNITWELKVDDPKELRKGIMAFNSTDGLMTQDTRQLSLMNNVVPFSGTKDPQ